MIKKVFRYTWFLWYIFITVWGLC